MLDIRKEDFMQKPNEKDFDFSFDAVFVGLNPPPRVLGMALRRVRCKGAKKRRIPAFDGRFGAMGAKKEKCVGRLARERAWA
ncbi:hypothetical protein EII20_09240 [Comamonadaceae bacterium OH2545_COT-014]|nr:hypothetical protein EII20_09240 [Comamonadaceae bacterium OH2545_COT-014]